MHPTQVLESNSSSGMLIILTKKKQLSLQMNSHLKKTNGFADTRMKAKLILDEPDLSFEYSFVFSSAIQHDKMNLTINSCDSNIL